jgi:SAM-dependent methyltransferase
MRRKPISLEIVIDESLSEPNWHQLIADYERIHLRLDPLRRVRFDTILDMMGANLPRNFAALDLGCGPGSLTMMMLERFPDARVAMVDHDFVLPGVGKEALARFGNRVHVLLLDLSKKGWEKDLPFKKVDAVVTSLAFHDLNPGVVKELYNTVFRILRKGGLLMNSDGILNGGKEPQIDGILEKVRDAQIQRGYRVSRQVFLKELKDWWKPIRKFGPLQQAIARRDEIVRKWQPQKLTMNMPSHLRALNKSGFREVRVVWQVPGSACILVAVK